MIYYFIFNLYIIYYIIIKCGNIGTSPLVDLILDERADRKDIDVRVLGSGAKMGVEQVEEVTK